MDLLSSGSSSESTTKLYHKLAESVGDLVVAIVQKNEHKDEKEKITQWAATKVAKVAADVANQTAKRIIEEDKLAKQTEQSDLVRDIIGNLWIAGKIEDIKGALAILATAEGGGNKDVIAHPWKKQKMIGKGAFGVVYKAVDSNGLQFAIKEVFRGSVQEQSLVEEIKCLTMLSHTNIVKCLGCARDNESVYMYMELLQGSIRDKLDKQKVALTEEQAKKYTTDVLAGLKYLHSQNIVHRDIKCGNVLLEADDTAKLADMGIVKDHAQETMLHYESQAGTFFWMSPEVLKGLESGRRSDVWSVGCTVYEMVREQPPFYSCGMIGLLFGPVIGNKIMSMEHYDLVKTDVNMSENLRNFLLTIFVSMESRPKAGELAEHEWLRPTK